MSLRLPPGDHLLRLATLTPANFGDRGGRSTVDRPVAVDAFDGLPYLPSSSLKGVIACRHGNAGSGDATRDRLYGAPDLDEDGGGRPGCLVFGDGELLSFPVVLAGVGRVTVVVGRTLYRLHRLGKLDLPGLRRVDPEDAYQGEVAASHLPRRARWANFGVPPETLASLAGDGSCLLAAPRLAADLWRLSVEERTLTRIGEDGTVEAGSLRTVELIPSETVFVCLVTNTSSNEERLGDIGVLQVGAWEAMGCGFLAADDWHPPPAGDPEPRPERPPGGGRPPAHETMVRAFQAVRQIAEDGCAAIARSAILDFGPRWRIRGLPGTLAFAAARAVGDETAPGRRGRERRAYRWLLATLFDLPAEAGEGTVRERTVQAITGEQPAPAELEETWLWMRRYSETMLRQEVAE